MGSQSGLGRPAGAGQLLHGWRPWRHGVPHRDLRKNCYYFHEFNAPERQLTRQ